MNADPSNLTRQPDKSKTVAHTPDGECSAALADVAAERRRQIAVEGWTPEHDDEHSDGQMALAAACYASPVLLYRKDERANATIFEDPWPWDQRWDKRAFLGNTILPNSEIADPWRRRNLVRAAALILAEIERLDRAILRAQGAEQ